MEWEVEFNDAESKQNENFFSLLSIEITEIVKNMFL